MDTDPLAYWQSRVMEERANWIDFLGERALKGSAGDGGIMVWSYSCLLCLSLGHTCCEPDHLSSGHESPGRSLKWPLPGIRARTSGKVGEAESERCFLPISKLIPELP